MSSRPGALIPWTLGPILGKMTTVDGGDDWEWTEETA